MRSSNRIITVALAAVACLALSSAPAWAQNATVKGKVVDSENKKGIAGATVDFFRTDGEGTFSATTDAGGNFTQELPRVGTYAMSASAPGRAPKVVGDLKPSANLQPLTIDLPEGDGKRPTFDEIKLVLSGDAEAEYERQRALKGQFDAKKARFDTGIKAMQSKDYNTAITELTAALEGLDNADVAYWGELLNAAGGNLAESHYRVAVDKYNSGARDEAKTHLERGARAIAVAIKANPAAPANYAIQGKTLLLLVDRFNMADHAETGAAAYIKASDLETTDRKAKIDYLVKAGDVYRAAYMTEPAIDAYKKALALDPNNLSALYGIGLAAMATSEENDQKRRQIYQTAADYLNAFVDKAGGDPRTAEAKGVLATLKSDFKITPKPLR